MKNKIMAILAVLTVSALAGTAAACSMQNQGQPSATVTVDGLSMTLSGGTLSVTGEGVPSDLAERVQKKTSVEKVVLGEGIAGVNDTTFRGLDGLREIAVEEGNPFLSAVDGVLFNKDRTALLYYPPAKAGASYAVPEGTAEIGASAFAGNALLKSVTFPDGLSRIGIDAFADCTALKEAVLPEGLQTVGDGAFENCTALSSLTLPESLSAIGDHAFQGCGGLTEVAIPSGLKKLGECVFRGCAGLTGFTVAEGNTVFHAVDGVLLRSGGRKLAQYPRGATRGAYAVPEGVEEIDYAAFEGNAYLTEVTFPDSLTKIGTAAFQDCSALTRVDMPDHVRAIDDAAFSGCTALKEVTLARYLESIGIEAFFNCPELKTVEVPFKVTFVGFRSLGYNALFGSKKYTDGFLLRCREGSQAQTYAERYGVAYEIVE